MVRPRVDSPPADVGGSFVSSFASDPLRGLADAMDQIEAQVAAEWESSPLLHAPPPALALSLSHSNSARSVASVESQLSIPMHIHITAAAPTINTSSQSAAASQVPSPRTAEVSPTAAAAAAHKKHHRRRESRFLSTAAALDAQSEAALLTPAGSTPLTASFAAALLHPAGEGASLVDSLSAPTPASGFSLLDGALARKKKKLLAILNGQGGDGLHARDTSISPVRETKLQEEHPANEIDPDDEDDTAPTYAYLIEDADVKAAEQAKVERLLRIHRHNMTLSSPLSVQLNLARLHYEQYLGNFKPTCMEYAQSLKAQPPAQQIQSARNSRTPTKTHLLTTPLTHSASAQSSPRVLSDGGSNSSSASNLSTVSRSSNLSRRLKKITFLTESLSDSSLELAAGAGRRPLASINDPMAKSPSRSHLIFPYGDRFDTGEIQLLNQEMMGKFGNESIANAVPASTLKSASVTATLYRTPRSASVLHSSLSKLQSVLYGGPGPSRPHDSLVGMAAGGLITANEERLGGRHPTKSNVGAGAVATKAAQLTGTPGPTTYVSEVGTIASKVHARTTLAPRIKGQSKLDFDTIESKRTRHRLEAELNKFSSLVRADLADRTIIERSPGPGAYFPKTDSTIPRVKGHVHLCTPHVPPLKPKDTPGVGEYDIGLTSRFGSMGRPDPTIQSTKASLTDAGVAASFIGFGSSLAKTVSTVGFGSSSARLVSGDPTKAPGVGGMGTRLIDFHAMPKITKRDWQLIKADESYSVVLPTSNTGSTGDPANPDSSDADPSVGGVIVPFEIATTLSRSRFGALHLSDSMRPTPKTLVTLRPPDIIPKFVIPRQILASRDEGLKLAWLKARARHNNHNRMKVLESSRAIQAAKRSRFLLLQDRDAKIALKNQLKITQSRWLVLLVHGWVFHAYRRKHEQSHRSSEVLKAVLVLQYYRRLKIQRLLSSQRYQQLFHRLRNSFGFWVIQFRIRKKKRSMGLAIRFLQDHLANNGTKKLLNVVQRFKHCIRILQRFFRASLRKIHAGIEMTLAQMVKCEERENATLVARAASSVNTNLKRPGVRCISVREVLLAELQVAREHQAEVERTAAIAAAAAAAAHAQATGATVAKGKPGGRGAALKKVLNATKLAVRSQSNDDSPSSPNSTSHPAHPPHAHGPSSHPAPSKSRHLNTTDSLTSGGGMLVRGPGGRASIVPIFQSAVNQHQDTKSTAAKGVAITSLAEYSLHLSDGVRRAVAAESCRLRRRKHRASLAAHSRAMGRYLTRHGSALQNGIELARVLLTGSSARIDADRIAFLEQYPPPFPRGVWKEEELRHMVYASYLLQAHLDEERAQAKEFAHPRVHPAHSAGSSAHPTRFVAGRVTLPLKVLVDRAPLCLSTVDAEPVAKVGMGITHLLELLALSGANVGLGLSLESKSEDGDEATTTSAHEENGAAAPMTHHQHQTNHNANRAIAPSRPATAAYQHRAQHGQMHGGHHQHHGHHAAHAHDKHHQQHFNSHHRYFAGHAPHHLHGATRPDEYDWRTCDVAPVGLLSFHGAMAASLRLIGSVPPVFFASHSKKLPAHMSHSPVASSDPFWDVHTHGVMSAIGMHVVRTNALQSNRVSAGESNTNKPIAVQIDGCNAPQEHAHSLHPHSLLVDPPRSPAAAPPLDSCDPSRLMVSVSVTPASAFVGRRGSGSMLVADRDHQQHQLQPTKSHQLTHAHTKTQRHSKTGSHG